jgi:periplasmic mercuric ion binding protein
MKTKVLSLVALFVLGTFTVFAGEKTEKFKVNGNCGMCEKRIEEAATNVDGVDSADWDKENQVIEVTFDPSKTDIHKINEAIALAGHDTEMHRASDEAYNNLHGCCKYERMAEKSTNSSHPAMPESGCTRSGNPASCCGSE